MKKNNKNTLSDDAVNFLTQVKEAAKYIRSKIHETTSEFHPLCGIITGTGIGNNLINCLTKVIRISYNDIPHCVGVSSRSHNGVLIFGYLNKVPVLVLNGRPHFYEGYTMREVTFLTYVIRQLGVKALFITSAVGGSSIRGLKPRDLVLVNDHTNLMGDNPLAGTDLNLGPRFPDMSEVYSKKLISLALTLRTNGLPNLRTGRAMAFKGPSIETAGEYQLAEKNRCIICTLSMIPEATVAHYLGMQVLGVGVVTDTFNSQNLNKFIEDEVINNANLADPSVTTLLSFMVTNIKKSWLSNKWR